MNLIYFIWKQKISYIISSFQYFLQKTFKYKIFLSVINWDYIEYIVRFIMRMRDTIYWQIKKDFIDNNDDVNQILFIFVLLISISFSLNKWSSRHCAPPRLIRLDSSMEFVSSLIIKSFTNKIHYNKCVFYMFYSAIPIK